ncbi:MAG: divalent-cation tolerance protein CutA [Alphaproteobacteria bacterium]
MNDYVLLYVTCPDKATACRIGRVLVDKRLAACVNVHGGHTAIYRWDGDVQEGEETAMTVKTRASLIGQVNQTVRAEHPDDVPCVVSLPIQGGNPDFLSWIIRETRDDDD